MNFSMKHIAPTALFALALIAIISAPHFHEVAEVEHEDTFGNRIMDEMRAQQTKAKAQAKVKDFQPSVFSTQPQAPVIVKPDRDDSQFVEDDDELLSEPEDPSSENAESPPWSEDGSPAKKMSAPVDFQPSVFVQKRHKVFSKPSAKQPAAAAKKVATFQPRVFQPKRTPAAAAPKPAAPKPAAPKRKAQKKAPRVAPKHVARRATRDAAPVAHLRHASTLAHSLPKSSEVGDVDTPDDSALRHMHEQESKTVKTLQSHVLENQEKRQQQQQHSAVQAAPKKETAAKKKKKEEATHRDEEAMNELLNTEEDSVDPGPSSRGQTAPGVDGNTVLDMFDEEAQEEGDQIPNDEAAAPAPAEHDGFGDDEDAVEEKDVEPERAAAALIQDDEQLIGSIPKFHPEQYPAEERVVTNSQEATESSDAVSTFEPRVFSKAPATAVQVKPAATRPKALTAPRGPDNIHSNSELLIEEEDEEEVDSRSRTPVEAAPAAAAKPEKAVVARPWFDRLLSNLREGGGFTAGKAVASEFFQPDAEEAPTKQEASFPDGSDATKMWNDVGLDDDSVNSANEFNIDADDESSTKKASNTLEMFNDDDAIDDEDRINDAALADSAVPHDLVLNHVQADVESDLSTSFSQMLN